MATYSGLPFDMRAANGAHVGDVERDCIRRHRHYRSLMPLAREARKPMFALEPADGAIGGHANAVQGCHRDFRALGRTVARRCRVTTA